MMSSLKTSCLMLLVMTVLTGVVYPLAITGIAQAVFPSQANGSLIDVKGQIRGSSLIGQPFDDPKYFWSRPSATGPMAYNAGSSSGSNLAVGNPALLDAVAQRVKTLKESDPDNKSPIPVDLVTASGSGLDPHISIEAARWQTARVARLRGMTADAVTRLVDAHTQGRQLGLLGEPAVNVLELNLALDAAAPAGGAQR